MNRQEIRDRINERPLTDFISLTISRKAGKAQGRPYYNCPICGSGTGKNGTGSFYIYPESNRVFCFSGGCFTDKGEDTLGALKTIWRCDETEAIRRAGYVIDDQDDPARHGHMKHPKHIEQIKHEPEADYSSFYRDCHEALKKSPEALEYLHNRGITDDSIDRFNLGYCDAWHHKKWSKDLPPSRRIIIPRSRRTYSARRIGEPVHKYDGDKRTQGLQKDLFNLEALNGETPIICEGELDTISLLQAGAADVIGIGSIVNAGTFLEEAKNHPEAVFILALDNDPEKKVGQSAGRDAQRKLAADMTAAGLAVLNVDPSQIYGNAKDGNEAFREDPERLKKEIARLEEQAMEMKEARDEEKKEALRKRTGIGMLEAFLRKVIKDRDFEPIATGISDIDRALQGGFIRGTLVMLGAPPAMGKTALAQWIFENMAAAGHDVLFLNLEMSREQLIARSLSRMVWKYDRKDLNALDILRGYAWTEEQRDTILKAVAIYEREVAPCLVYNPDGLTNSIGSILSAMEEETTRITAQGRPAPIICIDYLQLIDSGARDAIEGMKSVIFQLKDFAKRRNTVVFVIMANNRASNRSGTVELESGRDTSAIEYSGDLVLGLSYTAIEDRRTYSYVPDGSDKPQNSVYDLDTIRRLKKEAFEEGRDVPAVCNEVSLKILKNRFGEAERRANLIFDGKHTTFNLSAYRFRAAEYYSDFKEYAGATPFD